MRVCPIAILILASLPSWAQEALGPAAGKGINAYSVEKEAALGRQLATELRARTTSIASPNIQSYVDRLGHRLASRLPNAGVPFTFSVIAEDPCPTIHEPGALPGGYVFVPAALFLAAQDEAEFAGMLAHAMAHIAERHGTRQATRGAIVNYASTPLIFAGGWGGCPSGGVPLGFLAFQRGFERQADLLAVQTMAHAGFDPNGLVRYIERVQLPPSGQTPQVFSPLPARDERVAAMLSGIASLPAVDYPVAPGGEFGATQQQVRAAVPARTYHPPSLIRKRTE
jgi:beta-barrel assembly-enhancing protease